MVLDWIKAVALVFVAAILQVSVFSTVTILHGTPDLLLVAIICVALLRGPVVGAVVGFWGGLLLDTANLRHARRHVAAADGRGLLDRPLRRDDRPRPHARAVRLGRGGHAPRTRSASLAFHFVLGDPAPAREVLWGTLLPGDRAEPDPDLAGLRALRGWSCRGSTRRDRVERIHAVG